MAVGVLIRPGKTCDQAIQVLEEIRDIGLNNVQNSVPHMLFESTFKSVSEGDNQRFRSAQRMYDEWTLSGAKSLRSIFWDADIPARLRGERYSRIVHGEPSLQLAVVFNTELQELRSFFMDLANELREQKERYKRHDVRTLVLDTNDLLHFMRYDKIPWQRVFRPGTSVVIPHVVVDEIDKKSYATGDTTTRRRVRGVFGLLEETLTEMVSSGYQKLSDGTVVEVMLDEPGHVRLPNNDDEIVARACYLQQAIAPTPVTVITNDNGVRGRALAWGLQAGRLDEKYKIERLSAAEKAANIAAITFEPPAESD